MTTWNDRRDILRACARDYFTTPFPQHRLEDRLAFESYLRKRGIHVFLQHLRRCGLLVPLVVEGPLGRGLGRHRLERLQDPTVSYRTLYVDLGVPARRLVPFDPHVRLVGRGLYHPFQLLTASELFTRLRLGTELSGQFADHARKAAVTFAQSDEYTEMLRLLRLCIRIDPIAGPSVRGTVRYGFEPGRSFDDWLAWRASQDPEEIVAGCGFSRDDLRRLYDFVAKRATLSDPLIHWFPLVRNMERSRLEMLEGAALLAQSLYSLAELLRRFAERWLGERWPEEDDVRWGPQGPDVKRRFYGDERVTDGRRDVLRRITRQYGLDPQPKITWFVEGDTEVGFLHELGQRMGIDLENRGISVVNLHGQGALGGGRRRTLGGVWFRDRLKELQREECFPMIVVDAHPDADRALQQLDRLGLLPVGYVMWKTDFEEENFSTGELVNVANRWAKKHGASSLRVSDVKRQAKPTIVEAINSAFGPGFAIQKNREWGRRLAGWAATHRCPVAVRDGEGERPIVSMLLTALRSVDANYRATVEARQKGERPDRTAQ